MAREIANAGLDEGSARAAMMIAEALDDPDYTVMVVSDLMRRAHLDHTTATIAFSDALYAMIDAAKSDSIRTSSRAWLFVVARRIANKRSEVLSRDADGGPHAVRLQHAGGGPALAHVAVLPALDVALGAANYLDHRLDQAGP